jgi:hypothetical protein
MKKRIKILLSLLLVLAIFYSILYSISPNIYIKKKLSFQNCVVSYEFYLFGKYINKKDGNTFYNTDNLHNAKVELALCLLDLYIKTPNKETENKLIDIALDLNKNLNQDIIDFKYVFVNRYELFKYNLVY